MNAAPQRLAQHKNADMSSSGIPTKSETTKGGTVDIFRVFSIQEEGAGAHP